MQSFFWLTLYILPVLLAVGAFFYWLGSRGNRETAKLMEEKDASIEREQQRTDQTIRKLSAMEDQCTELQGRYDELLGQYEHLQRGAIPRRLLSEAEDRILKQQREINRLMAVLGHAPEPMSEFSPEPVKSVMIPSAAVGQPSHAAELEAVAQIATELEPEQQQPLILQASLPTAHHKAKAKSTRRRR